MDGGNPVSDGAAMLDAANASDNTPVADTSPLPQQVPGNNAPVNTPAPAPTNAAPYAKQLEQIPEGFRPLVEPVFKEWDQNVSRKLQEVHSRYEPWKQFVDAGVAPDQVSEAMNLYRMMMENPQRIYEAMGQHLGIAQQAGVEQGQADEDELDLGGGDPQFDLEKDPRFQQLAQQQEIILQQMQAVQEAREQQEGEQWLDQKTNEIEAQLKQKGLEPDWDYILTLTQNLAQNRNMNWDKAIEAATEAYVTKVQSFMGRPTATSSAPMVLPTGGGTPSNQTPAFESGKDRRAYGAAALQAALRNS